MPHYAEAFSVDPAGCFRFVSSAVPGARGMPHHCPLPIALRGTFIDAAGKDHRVSSCLDHGDALEDESTAPRRYVHPPSRAAGYAVAGPHWRYRVDPLPVVSTAPAL